MILKNTIIFDIDGLRPDVLAEALTLGTVPNIARILRPHAYHHPLVATAPSITFACQASIVLGVPPKLSGIVGNQFFDRSGKLNHGKPKYYGLDVGDSHSYDDALAVFIGRLGLANRLLPKNLPTIFEKVASHGWTSTPIHFMYSRGATKWIRPSALDLARFKRGKSFIGLSPEAFDNRMVKKLQKHLKNGERPNLLLPYFMGLDMFSHFKGPKAQADYLATVVDRQVGTILKVLEVAGYYDKTAYIFISDHGQISVNYDSEHCLRLGNSFNGNPSILYQTFQRIGRQLLRFPVPDSSADTILSPNGGFAHVYLKNRSFGWKTPPSFKGDVLTCAQGLYAASKAPDFMPLSNKAFTAILLRDIEKQGWNAPFMALNDIGEVVTLEQLFESSHCRNLEYPIYRLRELETAETGDLVILANGDEGFYFGPNCHGNHGGLHRNESRCVFSVGFPNICPQDWQMFQSTISNEFYNIRLSEKRTFNSLTDVAPTIVKLISDFSKK